MSGQFVFRSTIFLIEKIFRAHAWATLEFSSVIGPFLCLVLMKVAMSKKVAGIVLAASLVSGCATPLNNAQKQELNHWKHAGVKVEEKNEVAGVALGLLPGGGSFYSREYALGVVNLLLWPASILWDPISGYNGSQAINYYATQTQVNRLKKQEMAKLDDQLTLGEIDDREYVKARREIENKYDL